jgi:adenosylcobinamide kinase / adenosylcobinamide-phosphate guanylyltransferase
LGKSLSLILGGARSGKSQFAQQHIEATGQPALYVATATAGDAEMAARIAAHRATRASTWQTLEVANHVGAAIRSAPPYDWLLLDCLTLLATNLLVDLPEPVNEFDYYALLDAEIAELLAAYAASPAHWVIVSNEVGLGLVPPYPLGRYFRDGLGRANQRLAQAADRVIFMVAGLPLFVKGQE